MIDVKITWILFDLGNVLVDVQYGGFDRMASSIGIQSEILSSLFLDSQSLKLTKIGKKVETGEIAPQQFCELINRQFHCTVSPEDIVTWFGPEIDVIYPEIPDLINRLKGKYSLGILSNTFFGHWKHFRKTNLYRQFDAPMASHLLGYRKPDPQIFLSALEKINAVPSETLFIDDKQENVDAAKALGMNAFKAETAKEVIQGLQSYGIIPSGN